MEFLETEQLWGWVCPVSPVWERKKEKGKREGLGFWDTCSRAPGWHSDIAARRGQLPGVIPAVPRMALLLLALLGQGYSWSSPGAVLLSQGSLLPLRHKPSFFCPTQCRKLCPAGPTSLQPQLQQVFPGKLFRPGLLQCQPKARVRQILLGRVWISALRQQGPLSAQSCSTTGTRRMPLAEGDLNPCR